MKFLESVLVFGGGFLVSKSFLCFQEIFGTYPRYWGFYYTDLHHSSVPVLSKNDNCLDFQNFDIYKDNIPKYLKIRLIFSGYLGVSKDE